MSTADKLVMIAENVEKVYNAGFEAGKAEGNGLPAEFEWAKHTINKPLFNDDSWATENTVIYMPNVSNISEIFYNKNLTNIKILTVKTDVPVTNANYFLTAQNNVSYAFLEKLILECDFSQCDNFSQFLKFQRKLVSIEGQPLNLSSAVSFNFSYLEALESFRVERETIKVDFYVAASSNLDSDTIQSIVDGLADMTGGDAKTLILHSTVKGKLTETQLATITGKNWTVA